MKKYISKFIKLLFASLLIITSVEFIKPSNSYAATSEIANVNVGIEEEFVKKEDIVQYRERGDGAFELGYLINHGLVNEPTYEWNKCNYDFPAMCLVVHYNKHKDDVGVTSPARYLRKAIEFRRTAKKGVQGKPVSGDTPGVKRYRKNG